MNASRQPVLSQEHPAWINGLVLGVVIGVVCLVFQFRPLGGTDSSAHPTVDRPLPILQLHGLVGTEETVSRRDVEGQVVLVSFWGPEAPDSLDLVPQLAALQRDLTTRNDFRLLMVACERPNAPESFGPLKAKTEETLTQLGVTLPIYMDPDQRTRNGFNAIRISTGIETRLVYPTTFLLDRKGFIRGVWEGYRPGIAKEIQNSIPQLLQK